MELRKAWTIAISAALGACAYPMHIEPSGGPTASIYIQDEVAGDAERRVWMWSSDHKATLYVSRPKASRIVMRKIAAMGQPVVLKVHWEVDSDSYCEDSARILPKEGSSYSVVFGENYGGFLKGSSCTISITNTTDPKQPVPL